MKIVLVVFQLQIQISKLDQNGKTVKQYTFSVMYKAKIPISIKDWNCGCSEFWEVPREGSFLELKCSLMWVLPAWFASMDRLTRDNRVKLIQTRVVIQLRNQLFFFYTIMWLIFIITVLQKSQNAASKKQVNQIGWENELISLLMFIRLWQNQRFSLILWNILVLGGFMPRKKGW